MKMESCTCDNCGKDLKAHKGSYLTIAVGITSYHGMAYWAADHRPNYAGAVDVCNIECFLELVKKDKEK